MRRRSLMPLIAGTAAAMALLVAAALPMRGVTASAVVVSWFLPTANSFLFLVTVCVAFLAFGRHLVLGDITSFWTGVGSSGFAVGIFFNTLTFPGLLPGERQLVGSLSNTAVWEGSFALWLLGPSLLLAPLARWPGQACRIPSTCRWAIRSWLAGITALNILFVLLERYLPLLIDESGHFTQLFRLMTGGFVGVVSGVGAVISTRRYQRSSDVLAAYLAICQLAMLGVAILTFVSTKRFDVWWFVQRLLWAGGFLVILFGLLAEYVYLFRAEQEKTRLLEESEARLRGTFENAAVGITLVDDAGRFMRANGRFCEIVGYAEDELIGKYFNSFTHTEDILPDHSKYEQLMKGELARYEIEKRYIRKDGTHIWVRVTRSAQPGKSGIPAYSITVVEDITARKTAEEDLRRTAMLLQAVTENTPDFIFLKDRQGRMLMANSATLNELGKTAEEVLGKTDAEYLGGEAGVQIMANDRQVLESGKTITFEEILHPEGDRRIYLSTKSPYKDAGGNVIGVIGVSRDITKRKRAEGRLRRIFDSGMIGIFSWSMDGRIIDANDRFVEMLGLVRREISAGAVGYEAITPPEYRSLDEHAMEELRTKGIDTPYEKEFLRQDGSRVPVIVGAAVFEDNPEEGISFVVDISDRKQAENELQKAKEHLEVRVRERTAELTLALERLRAETEERINAVEELRKNEQMLMQQSRLAAMGEMLGNISHQWRQPLNVLALLLQELARAYEKGTFTREMLEKNVSRGRELIRHMSQTIDDFRTFLMPERAKRQFELREAVEKSVAMIGERLRGIELRLEADAPVSVEGYRNEYAQVVMNILINARDAFRERKVPAPVITVRIFSEGERGVVTIADNAGGVPEEIIGRIFEPYFTTKGPDKGTGIGLFMSRTIIEKNMGGRLTVRNSVEGAEFKIEV